MGGMEDDGTRWCGCVGEIPFLLVVFPAAPAPPVRAPTQPQLQLLQLQLMVLMYVFLLLQHQFQQHQFQQLQLQLQLQLQQRPPHGGGALRTLRHTGGTCGQ